jgi:hypothetical protein
MKIYTINLYSDLLMLIYISVRDKLRSKLSIPLVDGYFVLE